MGIGLKRSRVATLSLMVTLFALTVLPPQLASAAPSTTNFPLPAGGVTTGVAYSGGFAYTASYEFGFIMKVNATTGTYVNLTKSTGSFNDIYYALALNHNDIWLTRRDTGNNGNPAGVTVFASGKAREVVNGSGEWDGVGIVGGFAYSAQGSTLYKISLTSPFAYTTHAFTGGGGAYPGVVGDSKSNVWFSDILNGKLYRFNTTSGLFTSFSGFHRPLGVAIDGSFVYAAENCGPGSGCKPAIAQMSTSGGVINRTSVPGSPYGILTIKNAEVWTSDGEDLAHTETVCVLGGQCVKTGEINFFIAGDNSKGTVYVAYYGSGIVKVSGLALTSLQRSCCKAGYLGSVKTGSITEVDGTWNVPPATCQPTLSVSQFVTIYMGVSTVNGGKAVAVRLFISCAQGTPSATYTLQAITPSDLNFANLSLTVHPGDKLSAIVKANSLTTKASAEVTDLTTGLHASRNGTVSGSETSAQWLILFNPGVDLANFTTPITFSKCQAVTSGGKVAISGLGNLLEYSLFDNSGISLAKTSPLSNNGESFKITWENPS